MRNVIHLTNLFSPAAGGLESSLFGLLRELHTESNAQFLVSSLISPTDSFREAAFKKVECKSIGPDYFPYPIDIGNIFRDIKPKLFHIHGCWSPYTLIALKIMRANGIPYILSPHGMYDSNALAISRLKKKFAMRLFERRAIQNASCLHALCDSEYRSIRRLGYKGPVAIIPNGTSAFSDEGEVSQSNPDKVMLYLGRLHEKKRVLELVSVWRDLEMNNRLCGWRLVVAGWGSEQYVSLLEQEVSDLVSCQFIGPIFDSAKIRLLKKSGFLVLPSVSEGMSMTVLEAWGAGVPTLVSRSCAFDADNMIRSGLIFDDDLDQLKRAITLIVNMSDQDLAALRKGAHEVALSAYSWHDVSQKHKLLQDWVIEGGSAPSFVQMDL